MKTLIYNARIIDENTDDRGAVLIEDGFIKTIIKGDLPSNLLSEKDITPFDAQNLAVMPAFIDMHAHFRYPGQPEKEELKTALNAAAAGGFGTLILMPNTNPVVSSNELAEKINNEAKSFELADVFQTISITKDFGGICIDHLDNLDNKITPVISEDGHDVENTALMLDAMKKCAEKNVIVSCHSEDTTLAKAAAKPRKEAVALMKNKMQNSDTRKIILEKISEAERILACAEDTATERNLRLAEEAGCNIHIAHVSTEYSLNAVKRAKLKRPGKVSCEATPHHIALSGECSEFVNPPIRQEKDRLAVLQGLKDGSIDVIATDHAPHSASDKENGACGFTGLETAFSVCYTYLVKTGIISLQKLSALMSANPAKRLSLNRGLIKPNYKADFVFVDLENNWTVNSKNFYSKGKYSPFDEKLLSGKIVKTMNNGKFVFG